MEYNVDKLPMRRGEVGYQYPFPKWEPTEYYAWMPEHECKGMVNLIFVNRQSSSQLRTESVQ